MNTRLLELYVVLTVLSALEPLAFAQAETGAPATAGTPESESPPTTIDDHIRNLGSLEARTRIEAAMALRELRDPRAIPALTQTVRNDPNPEARGWALRALWQTDPRTTRDIVISVARTDADSRVRDLALQLVPEAAPPPQTAVAQQADDIQSLEERYVQLQLERRAEVRRSGRPMRVVGWLTFGLTYGLTLCLFGPITFLEAEEEYGWPMFIPIFGPIVSASFAFGSSWEEDIMFGVMMILNAMTQITGFAIAIVGQVKGRRYRTGQGRTISVQPFGPGLSMVARF